MSLRKSEAARKSKGPKSPEGKAISSRNSLKYGLTAKTVVLDLVQNLGSNPLASQPHRRRRNQRVRYRVVPLP